MFLFLTIIAVCLGDIINVFGVKLSWIFAGFSVAAFIFEYVQKRYRLPNTSLHLKVVFGFFVFWLVYATIQLLIIDKNMNAFSFYRSLVISIFIVLMLILNAKSFDDVLFFNKALIFGYTVNLAIAVWELCTGTHVIDEAVRAGFVYGVFVNTNDLCTMLAFGIFALILNLLLTKKHIFLSIAAILFSVYIILYNESRASLLGILFLLLYWEFFEIALLLRKSSKKAFICYITAIIAVPLIGAMFILSRYSLIELVNMFGSDHTAQSDSLRAELTRKALEITKDSAFLGVGPGQSIQIIGVNIHNFFLEILAEYGLIILSGIIYIFVVVFAAYKTKLPSWISSFMMAFIPFFMFVSISSSSAARIKATWVILTLVLLAVVYGRKEAKDV